MAEALVFLQDMAVVTIVAAVTTILFHRLHLPVVLGYILAGLIIGPLTGPLVLVRDISTIEVLGQLGVVFLFFALGLEFRLALLRKVGLTATVAGLLQAVVVVTAGHQLGRAFGLPSSTSLLLGAALAITSTVVLVRLINDRGERGEEWAQITYGLLLVEDILAILLLTLLAASGGRAVPASELGPVLLRLGLFVGAAVVVGLVLVPRLVSFIARTHVEEMLVVAALGLGFGMALVAAHLGFSPALGAFIMGALIAESSSAERVEHQTRPIRDLFAAIFFVTVGTLLDPRLALHHWGLVLAASGVAIVGKAIAASFACFLTGTPPRTALRVGLALAPIGEFSFVIAAAAATAGLAAGPLYEVIVGVALLTTLVTPLLLRLANPLSEGLARIAPRPLATYANLYHAWIARLRARGDPTARDGSVPALVRAGFYAAAFLALLVVGAASIDPITDWAQRRLPQLLLPARIVGWAVVGAVAAPFLLLFLRSLRRAAGDLASAATPRRLRVEPGRAYVERVLRETFFLGGLVLTGAGTLAFLSPFAPALPLLGAIVAGLAVSGALLYRSLVQFQAHVDDTLGAVLGAAPAGGGAASRRELLAIIREKYPWDVAVRVVEIHADAYCTHRRIQDLKIRTVTGATVAGIQRGPDNLLNPDPVTVILPGDRIALIGEEAQVESAALLLAQRSRGAHEPQEETVTRQIRVEERAPLVGLTLLGTRLRERTGATVVGLVRDGERMPHPPPTLRIEAGDLLLVVGTRAQIERVRKWAKAASPPSPASRPPPGDEEGGSGAGAAAAPSRPPPGDEERGSGAGAAAPRGGPDPGAASPP